MTEPRWDDGRLRRAYRDRFGTPAPADLVGAVVDGLPVRHRQAKRLQPAVAALAATVAIAVGLGVVMSRGPFISPPREPTASPTPPPLMDGFPTEIVGLTVISVSEAIALREAGPDDTEIAVRGWEPPLPVHSCPFIPQRPSPVERRCGDDSWLTQEREVLWVESDVRDPQGSVISRTVQARNPSGPALPTLYRLEAPRDPVVPDDPSMFLSHDPRRVVLVGHFADYRAGLCLDPDACRQEFVVDARVWIDGRDAGRNIVSAPDDARPRLRPGQVIAMARAAAENALVGTWVAELARNYAFDVDPRVAKTPGLEETAIVWVVRQLVDDGGRPLARTFFINDETGRTFVGRADGIADVTADLPEPSPVAFPGKAFGLSVISVEEAIAFHHLEGEPPLAPETEPPNDQELAVRGFYLVPPPDVGCLEDFCPDGGRLWLMAAPEEPWQTVDPSGLWERPAGPALNLVVSRDVLFDLPTVYDRTFAPLIVPVVVVGHFLHERERNSPLHRWLYVDALAWRAGEEVKSSDALLLNVTPTEERSVVEARIAAHTRPPMATWATVMSGAIFAETHRNPSLFDEELGRAEIVWQVRRLVTEAGYPVVRTAWTADGGSRVWLELWFDYYELQPTHTVELDGAVSLGVVDYRDVVSGATVGSGADPADARVVPGGDGHPSVRLSNPGGDTRLLRISWAGRTCAGWRLEVFGGPEQQVIKLRYPPGPCPSSGSTHSVVLTLSVRMPADGVAVDTSSGVGG